MATLLENKSLNYSDVNLIAQPGAISSRKDIPIEGYRIVVSGMTSIVCHSFIEAVACLPKEKQPTIHIPRDIHWLHNMETAYKCGLEHIFVGVGLDSHNSEPLAQKYGYNKLLLDVANGYAPNVKKKVKELIDKGFEVIVGSVHTKEGLYDLVEAGATIIRSGIGPGSACITADSTGFTRNTFTEIIELTDNTGVLILADGGFKSTADIIKAFLAGANYIMSGRIFVDAKEARLRMDGSNIYYGMASVLGKEAMGKEVEYIEGKQEELSTENVRALKLIIDDIWGGIRSGVSYSGYKTLTDSIGNGIFEEK